MRKKYEKDEIIVANPDSTYKFKEEYKQGVVRKSKVLQECIALNQNDNDRDNISQWLNALDILRGVLISNGLHLDSWEQVRLHSEKTLSMVLEEYRKRL